MNIKQLENQCKYEDESTRYLNFCKSKNSIFTEFCLFKNFILDIDSAKSYTSMLDEETFYRLCDFYLHPYQLIGLNTNNQLWFISIDQKYDAYVSISAVKSLKYLLSDNLIQLKLMER